MFILNHEKFGSIWDRSKVDKQTQLNLTKPNHTLPNLTKQNNYNCYYQSNKTYIFELQKHTPICYQLKQNQYKLNNKKTKHTTTRPNRRGSTCK